MNSFYDRSHEENLCEPLRTYARELDAREPADDTEAQAKHFGQPYIDHEGNWHNGQYYTDQNDVPISMRMNGRWPGWLREGLAWLIFLVVPAAVFGLWLDRVWFAFHVFILRMVALLG